MKDFEYGVLKKETENDRSILEEKVTNLGNVIEECEKEKATLNTNVQKLQVEKINYIATQTALLVGKEKDLNGLQVELQTVRNDLKKLHYESEDSKIYLETSRRNSSNIVSSLQEKYDTVNADLMKSKIEKDSTAEMLKSEQNKSLQLNEQIIALDERIKNDAVKGSARLLDKEELISTLSQKQRDSNFKLSNLEKEIIILTAQQKEGQMTLESVNRDTSAERAVLKSEISTLKDEVATLKVKHVEKDTKLESVNRDSSAERAVLKSEISTLKDEVATLQVKHVEKDTKLESVNRDTSAERAVLKSEIVTLKTDVALMKEEVLKANEAKVESDKQIVALSMGLKEQNDSHTAETEGYTAAITKLKGKYRESLGDLQSQSSKAEASAEKEEKLLKRIDELEESSTRMSSEFISHDKEIIQLKSDINLKDSEIVTLRSNDLLVVSALQAATQDSKLSSERFQKKILDLEVRNLQLVTKVEDLSTAYDAKCSSFDEIFEISEENKSERTHLINELELVGMKKEIEIVKNNAEITILKKEKNDLTLSNTGLKNEIDVSNEKVKHFSSELNEVRTVHAKSIEKLQNQLSALQTEKLKLDAMTQNKILEKKLIEMRLTVDSLTHEKENLQNNFTDNINEVIDQNLKSQRQNHIISEYNESK